jgi:hypothetical protein
LRQYVTYSNDEWAEFEVEADSVEEAEEMVQAAIDSGSLDDEFGEIEWYEGDDQDNRKVVIDPEVVSVEKVEEGE